MNHLLLVQKKTVKALAKCKYPNEVSHLFAKAGMSSTDITMIPNVCRMSLNIPHETVNKIFQTTQDVFKEATLNHKFLSEFQWAVYGDEAIIDACITDVKNQMAHEYDNLLTNQFDRKVDQFAYKGLPDSQQHLARLLDYIKDRKYILQHLEGYQDDNFSVLIQLLTMQKLYNQDEHVVVFVGY